MNWYYKYCDIASKFIKIEKNNNSKLSGREVLVKPLVSGICGSDLSQIFHLKENVSVGHEWVGRIEQIGNKVLDYNVGDIVSSVANVSCGHCPACLEENPGSCKSRVLLGAKKKSILSDQVQLDFSDLVPVPKDLSLEDSVLLEVAYIGDCSYYAADSLGIVKDTKVLIFGAGPIGIFSALSFKHRAIEDITIIEMVPQRIQKAKDLGFKAYSFAEFILDDKQYSSYDIVLDCTGDHNGAGALSVLPMFAKEFGSVVIVGKYYKSKMPEKSLMAKALKATWVANHKHENFIRSIDFWKDKISLYTEILTKSFSIHEINDAYEEAKARSSLKCLLKY